MSGHTPGPWVCGDGPDGYQRRLTDVHTTGRVVCDVMLSADARLIAASPDLLAALRDLDEAYCDVHPDMTRERRDFGRKALVAARAAIAKATGGDQ